MNQFRSHSVPVSSSLFASFFMLLLLLMLLMLLPISSWFIIIKKLFSARLKALVYFTCIIYIILIQIVIKLRCWNSIQFNSIENVIETACIPCHSIVFRSLYQLDNRWILFLLYMLCWYTFTRLNNKFFLCYSNEQTAAAVSASTFYLFNFHLFIIIGQCNFFAPTAMYFRTARFPSSSFLFK